MCYGTEENRRGVHPRLDRRPARLQPRKPDQADPRLREEEQHRGPGGIHLPRRRHQRPQRQEAAGLPAHDRGGEGEAAPVRGHPRLEILALRPQSGGKRRL